MVRESTPDYTLESMGNSGQNNTVPLPPNSANPQQKETNCERRNRWSALFQQKDYHTVITEVLSQELPKYKTSKIIDHSSPGPLMTECIFILASAPLIFSAAVDGTLAQQFRTSIPLQAEYATIHARAHTQPSIYIHLLADKDGVAPTPNQLLTIQEIVSQYIAPEPHPSQNSLASGIDNISPPPFPTDSSALGLRKHLRTQHTPHSQSHIDTLQRFCSGILNRWAETPALLRETPVQHPPTECGYARNAHKRLRQHRHHQSSNYVMNLTEDICAHLHATGQFTQLFYMHQYIIYLIFRPSHAEIAEIFCSGLLQVWVDDGGGFNHYPAGRSNRSAQTITAERWEEFQRHAKESSSVVENVKSQVEAVDKLVLLLNENAAKLWREVAGNLRGFIDGT